MASCDPDGTDPDGTSSRARMAGAGWLPWACGAGVGVAQLAVVIVLPDGARPAGSFVLAVLTLAVVAGVVFAGPRRRR
jgi:hypothetical protein